MLVITYTTNLALFIVPNKLNASVKNFDDAFKNTFDDVPACKLVVNALAKQNDHTK